MTQLTKAQREVLQTIRDGRALKATQAVTVSALERRGLVAQRKSYPFGFYVVEDAEKSA